MAEPIALAALVLDAALGWPDALYRRIGHPVGLFARIIARCEARWNRPERSFGTRRMLGLLTLALLVTLAGGAGWIVQRQLLAHLGPWGWLAVAALAWPARWGCALPARSPMTG